MKHVWWLAAAVVMVAVTSVRADTYRLSVKKVDQNFYVDRRNQTIIETQQCLALAPFPTDAVLVWRGGEANNWLYFVDDQQRCAVVAVR